MQEIHTKHSGNLADRTDTYVKSPYGKKLIKVRSSSVLKEQAKQTKLTVTSPPLKQKNSGNLPGRLSLNNSFNYSKKDIESRNNSNKRNQLKPSYESENGGFDSKIQELLQKQKENGINLEIFENFQKVFDEIIEKDKVFGKALEKIKLAYHDWLAVKINSSKEIQKLKSENFEFSKKLTEEIEENKQLHRKVQKLSRENVELGRALDEKESNFKTLQDYLQKITNLVIDEIPQDLTSWKVLVSENKSYSDLCAKLKSKIKILKKKESKLMTLFWNLKQKGYPVEKIYDCIDETNTSLIQTGKPRKSSRLQSALESKSVLYETEKSLQVKQELNLSQTGISSSYHAGKLTRRSTKRSDSNGRVLSSENSLDKF